MAKILVVEDEAIVAMGVKHKLESMGHDVVGTVATGKDAIRASTEHHPDLVLMDIILKGEMDGVEAAKEIKKRLNIPIIYLTAYSDEETLMRAKVTEPSGYLIKPFKSSDLKANIEMTLYRHESAMKEKEAVKEKIITDFYNFILTAMPGDKFDDNLRDLLSDVFRERIKRDLKPEFESYLDSYGSDDLLEACLSWIADLFESMTVRVGFLEDDESIYVEFENCPWFEEASKNPWFCLNCEEMIKMGFEWAEIDCEVTTLGRITDDSERCLFNLNTR